MATHKRYTYQKVKLMSFTVATGILLVIWQSIDQLISLSFQMVFLGVCMFLTGIPHGALDHLVEQEQARRQNSRFDLLAFSIRYLAIIITYSLAWYAFPQLSLFIFLLISCWHFGETDIELMPGLPWLTVILRLLYGISVLVWILLPHQKEVNPILLHMVHPENLIYIHWRGVVSQLFWLIPVSGIIILAVPIFAARANYGNRYHYWLALQLSIILLCGYYLPLLPAFVLYFAGWHSFLTLINITGFMTSINTAGHKPLLIFWLKALPFSLTAITGLLVAAYLFKNYAPLLDPLPLLFIFLSLITLPHMEVMHKLNSQIKA
jgi:Brp/Blh family beta-carotene 15,15'-monooxygenase